jgi:hypothetical protein
VRDTAVEIQVPRCGEGLLLACIDDGDPLVCLETGGVGLISTQSSFVFASDLAVVPVDAKRTSLVMTERPATNGEQDRRMERFPAGSGQPICTVRSRRRRVPPKNMISSTRRNSFPEVTSSWSHATLTCSAIQCLQTAFRTITGSFCTTCHHNSFSPN